MSKLSVCVCGPRPKASVTGLSLAFELLIKGLEQAKVRHSVVDAAFGGDVQKAGAFSVKRAFETLWVILEVWLKLPFADVYYATLSTSIFGFIRDFTTGMVAKLLGKKVVFHLHGGGFEEFYCSQKPLVQSLVRVLYRRVDIVIVLGELLKEQFYCLGESIDDKLVVVPNGLTLGVEDPGEIKRLMSKPFEMLYMSSLMPSKGFKDVIDAVIELKNSNNMAVHLSLCGSFVTAATEHGCQIVDESSLNDYLKEHNISDSVTYCGQVLGGEKEKRFREADVFLLPTAYPWEGQPLSIIEAMAYSLPVISCAHKGIPELVDDGATGYLTPKHSVSAISGVVAKMSDDPVNYKKMSIAARQKYQTSFTRNAHLRKIIAVILGCDENELTKVEL
jgi:glycosyltransferase involved in cell wall biosynthesis